MAYGDWLRPCTVYVFHITHISPPYAVILIYQVDIVFIIFVLDVLHTGNKVFRCARDYPGISIYVVIQMGI